MLPVNWRAWLTLLNARFALKFKKRLSFICRVVHLPHFISIHHQCTSLWEENVNSPVIWLCFFTVTTRNTFISVVFGLKASFLRSKRNNKSTMNERKLLARRVFSVHSYSVSIIDNNTLSRWRWLKFTFRGFCSRKYFWSFRHSFHSPTFLKIFSIQI